VRRYAERRGLDPLRPESEIVVQRPAPERPAERQPAPAEPPSRPAPDPGLAQAVALGRAAQDQVAARDLVETWGRLLGAYNTALPGLERDPALGGTRAELVRFARGLEGQPGAVRVLREQGEAFGMAERPNLARMLADPQPERMVAGIMAASEDGMRAQLQQVAEQEIARQQEATRQQAVQARQRPSQGMGMG